MDNISVIIPTLNRAEYAEAIVRSLTDQTIRPREIIVVNQGGERRLEKLSGVQYIHVEPCGPAAARNIGASSAKGEILLFVDDDGRIAPDFIEKHLFWYQYAFVDVVHGGVLQDGQQLPDEPELPAGADAAEWLRLSPNCRRRQMTIGLASGNLSIRREVFFDSGGFDERFGRCEDKELGLRLFRAGRVIIYDPGPLFTHLRAPEGTRGRMSPSFSSGLFRPEPHPGEYLLYLKHLPGWQARLWILERLTRIWAAGNLFRPDRCLIRTVRLRKCIREAHRLMKTPANRHLSKDRLWDIE
jgi:glycosyltransferase involved in cell wall biosynthesis